MRERERERRIYTRAKRVKKARRRNVY